MIQTDPQLSKTRSAVSLLGVPFDASSTYLRGPAMAPPRIREALYSESGSLWTEGGIDLGAAGTLQDAGDLKLPPEAEPAFVGIERAVREIRKHIAWYTKGLSSSAPFRLRLSELKEKELLFESIRSYFDGLQLRDSRA